MHLEQFCQREYIFKLFFKGRLNAGGSGPAWKMCPPPSCFRLWFIVCFNISFVLRIIISFCLLNSVVYNIDNLPYYVPLLALVIVFCLISLYSVAMVIVFCLISLYSVAVVIEFCLKLQVALVIMIKFVTVML